MSKVASNMKRIQYTTSDSSASSLTIDETIFYALDKKMGDANKWCKEKAREVRAELEEEAKELQAQGRLIKIDNLGNKKDMEIPEYIRGKVSNGVRLAAHLEVIDARYL